MKEDTIEKIVILFVICFVFIGFGWMITESEKDREQNLQKNIQEINECLEKTSDRDWCFNKFLK